MIREFVRANRNIAAALEKRFPGFFLSPSYKDELDRRIAADIARLHPAVILEVGGIDRPLLSRSPDFRYVGLDIESQPTCYDIYDQFIVQSIEQPVDVKANMVISITLLEHVPDNTAAITSMYDVLQENGTTHHYIPSKWHPYSVALRLVGPRLQKKLIAILRPAAVDVTGYPAFFNQCSPGEMTALFKAKGFKDINLKAYYHAADYFAFFVPAFIAVAAFESLCSALKLKFFASGFVISARK